MHSSRAAFHASVAGCGPWWPCAWCSTSAVLAGIGDDDDDDVDDDEDGDDVDEDDCVDDDADDKDDADNVFAVGVHATL
jgi:hypothetical protein